MSDGYEIVLPSSVFAHIRQNLINSEIEEITNKIVALDSIRAKLEQDLLTLQEEDLELDDECGYKCCRDKFQILI